MKERGLICQEWKVWTILKKRKTSLRRPVKFPFKTDSERVYGFGSEDKTPYLQYSPYGEPGDRVYIRETWTNYHTIYETVKRSGASFLEVSDGSVGYKADGYTTIKDFIDTTRLTSGPGIEDVVVKDDRWLSPSIMPKKYARIWLEITDVRVERVQDITREQIRNEGIVLPFSPRFDNSEMSELHQEYKNFWNTRYKNWDLNPWTWVYDFKRIDK